jgi:hypothetical protein
MNSNLNAFAQGLTDGYNGEYARPLTFGFNFQSGLLDDYMDGHKFGAQQSKKDFPQLELRQAA